MQIPLSGKSRTGPAAPRAPAGPVVAIFLFLLGIVFVPACAADSAPVAAFISNASSGNIPLHVQFIDSSANTPTSWVWSFGDGGTSTEQNPVHTYTTAGSYAVTLTASNAAGSNTASESGYITANAAAVTPVALFYSNVSSGTIPLNVQFLDSSANSPASWAWSFGDGGTSTEQNPVHTYSTAGTFTVTLTATNAGGSNTVTKTGHIVVSTVSTAPVAAFQATAESGTAPLTIQFVDSSANTPVSWIWSFGDGNTSTLQNPSHTYTTEGSYTVTLTATNSGGSSTVTKAGYITVACTDPVARFTANVTSGRAPLTVQFTDTSEHSPTSWTWKFGDGDKSTDQNPIHEYADAGTYTVTLTAKNSAGSNTTKISGYITVSSALSPVASFTADKSSGTVPFTVRFTDISTGAPSGWLWSFGDGQSSSEQNPVHTYTLSGTYTVTLTTTGSGGNSSSTAYFTAYLADSPAPVITTQPVTEIPAETDTGASGPDKVVASETLVPLTEQKESQSTGYIIAGAIAAGIIGSGAYLWLRRSSRGGRHGGDRQL